ncbi:CoxG family protein [Haloarchaeobius sp. TZWWS8]|uniref:CoxG family protein n=1 Tax=Haloarchaeobius sp. TZWWS8 TaxID=3446121 RepID=UPI003EBB5DEC
MPRTIEDIDVTVTGTVRADPRLTWVTVSDTECIREHVPGLSDLEHVGRGPAMTDGGAAGTATVVSPTRQAIDAGETYTATLTAPLDRLPMEFDTYCTVEEHRFPRTTATVGGDGSMGSFDAQAGITLEEDPDGTRVEWSARVDVAGPIAGLGEDAIRRVVTHVVESYVDRLDATLA